MKNCILWMLTTGLLVACVSNSTPAPASQVSSDTPLPTKTIAVLATSTIFPTDIPTTAPTVTPIPCLTSNNTASEHEWCPENVSMLFDISSGDGGGDITAPPPPNLILYADGSLFITHAYITQDTYRVQILFKKLNRQEICQHLNTFEEIGYLDYDPLSYEFIGGSPIVKGAYGSTMIDINAWKSHHGDYYELGYFLRDELTGELANELQAQGIDISERKGWPTIAPELRKAYYFLCGYPVENFEIYQPEKLGVWMLPIEKRYLPNYGNPEEWLLAKPSLAEMFSKIDLNGAEKDLYVVLTGDESKRVYDFLDQSYMSRVFYEENTSGEIEYFILLARPLLPYELPGCFDSQIPAPNSPKPNFTLACSPADGVLPIPESLTP